MKILTAHKLSLPVIAGLSLLGTAVGGVTPAQAMAVDYLQLDPSNAKPGHLDQTGDTFAVEFSSTGTKSYLAPSIDADQYAVAPTYKTELPDSGNVNEVDSNWGTGSQAGSTFSYGYTFSNNASHTGVTGNIFGKNGSSYDLSSLSNLDHLRLDLYQDNTTSSGGYTPGATLIGSQVLDLSSGNTTFDFAGLTHGVNTLVLSGNFNADQAPVTLSGTIQPVPLPGSVVMFGAALAGLTAFGARRKTGATSL